MDSFFAELKRRHLYRIAATYSVVAWIILQLVNNVAPVLDLPAWIARAFLLLLVIGFPVALLFAWMRELPPADSATNTNPADLMLAGVAVGMIAIFAYQQFAPMTESGQAGVEAARIAAAKQAGISVAVLPFANMSGDATQEFFSDGMTEEITSALAKIPDLRVVGRTSAFEFKGQNRNLRDIGRALSATHLLEGSVRKAGTRLRITAQLVKADDGVNVWSDSYDRELNDVFAIQEDIARAIAGALRMPLGLKPGEQLVSSRTNNLDTYQEYLRVKVLVRARGVGARAELEALLKRDPNFAPAWVMWSDGTRTLSTGALRRGGSDEELRKVVQSSLDEAEMAARKAIELDPTFASGYAQLSVPLHRRGKWTEAENFTRRALALDPDNPDALSVYSNILASAGRLKEALPIRVQLRTLEPFDTLYNISTATLLEYSGEPAAGIAILESISPDIRLNYNRNVNLAMVYADQERYADAVNTLLLIANPEVERAAEVLRSAPKRTAAPQNLPLLRAELSFVYAHVGASERILEEQERGLRIGNLQRAGDLWNPRYAPLRKTERFKTLVRNMGLVDYWRERGWADSCHPVGADDFACE